MTPEIYCREKAAPAGSNLYYSTLYQTKQSRRNLYALFAFQDALQNTLLLNTDLGAARLKLQWWREETDKLFNHDARHPVTRELTILLEQVALEQSLFTNYIDSIETYLNFLPCQNYSNWLQRESHGAGGIWRAAIFSHSIQDKTSLDLAGTIGGLLSMLDTLLNLPAYYNKGIPALPQDELDEYSIDPALFLSAGRDDRAGKLFKKLITNIMEALEACYQNFPKDNRWLLLFCLIRIRLALALCKAIKANHFNLLQNRTGLSPVRKLWFAWRTKCREMKR